VSSAGTKASLGGILRGRRRPHTSGRERSAGRVFDNPFDAPAIDSGPGVRGRGARVRLCGRQSLLDTRRHRPARYRRWQFEDLARERSPQSIGLGMLVVLVKVAGGLLALALVRPLGIHIGRRLFLYRPPWEASFSSSTEVCSSSLEGSCSPT
jgi:hypothetical protein